MIYQTKRYSVRRGDSDSYMRSLGRYNDIESLCANPDRLRLEDCILSDKQKKRILNLRSKLKLLPRSYRKTLKLYYFKHRTQKEIALEMGISRSLIKSYLYNSVSILKEMLKEPTP